MAWNGSIWIAKLELLYADGCYVNLRTNRSHLLLVAWRLMNFHLILPLKSQPGLTALVGEAECRMKLLFKLQRWFQVILFLEMCDEEYSKGAILPNTGLLQPRRPTGTSRRLLPRLMHRSLRLDGLECDGL